jgi:hypothetical protein
VSAATPAPSTISTYIVDHIEQDKNGLTTVWVTSPDGNQQVIIMPDPKVSLTNIRIAVEVVGTLANTKVARQRGWGV